MGDKKQRVVVIGVGCWEGERDTDRRTVKTTRIVRKISRLPVRVDKAFIGNFTLIACMSLVLVVAFRSALNFISAIISILLLLLLSVCVRACVRACVCACVRVCCCWH